MANNATASCAHIAQVNQNIDGKTKGCEECEKTGSEGSFTSLSHLWTCRLL